ncbi:MAG: hypothetical protein ACK5D5_09800 [Bacteroidota bacterium]
MKKNFIKKYFVFLLFLFFNLDISAQRFNADSVKFVKDLDDFFQEYSSDKKEATKWVEDFKIYWKKPQFSAVYKESVYKICNQMAAKKFKPTPYFKDYLISVANFIENKYPYEKFGNWTSVLEKMISGKNNKLTENYLDMSTHLFTNNCFYKSSAFEWRTDNYNFKFEYDSLPKVVFETFTLIGTNTRDDSVSIENTKGIFYITSGRFYGNGGKVPWTRVGLSSDVYAEIKKYMIDCKAGAYTADSVTFYNKKYLDAPQKGVLNDKLIIEGNNPTYPRFDSYNKRLTVKNISPDVDFDGGFSMRGPKFVGSGEAANPAKLVFKRNNERMLEVISNSLSITEDKFSSSPAAIKFILINEGKRDSIYHPGLSFKYLVAEKKISLIRTDEGIQKSPFYSSFHKMDLYIEEVTWKMDEPKIDFAFIPGNLQGEAAFESEDFFLQDRFKFLQGFDEVNPILTINNFYNSSGKKKNCNAKDLADYLRWSEVDLRPVLVKMMVMGMLDFNPTTNNITFREKLFKYARALTKQSDYDIITIRSVNPGKSNGVLNLVNNNFDMLVTGVKSVLLSDSQRVFIFPRSGELRIKRNRDIEFSGIISAGKFEMFGKDFRYSYERNKIAMNNVDSVRIYVTPFSKDEAEESGNFRKVETVIENLYGELAVDHPSSHSGRLAKSEYPIFTSFKESFAFYDKKNIQRGAYNRSNFYFKLDAFVIDSLDNFTNKALHFDGEFSSSGIFPNFRETLKLQKDYSLGFVRKTPPGGFALYGGKAKFDNEIRLSNKGLSGDGTVEFGPSTSVSENFIYYPDSMNGIASTFDVKETTTPDEFPVSHGENVKIHWKPNKDLMQATNTKDPFWIFNKETLFQGRFDLSLKELNGKGKVDFEKADVLSRKILFKRRKFFSDTANFHLRALDGQGFTFSTDNVNTTIDLDARTGLFVSNGKGSLVRFDKNQYICYMERFKWYMDSEDIQIGDENRKIQTSREDDLNIEGPEFISVHPNQDSLRFFSPAAKYNLRECIIHCLNVPFINIADARIFPDSGKVTIYKKAVIDTLKNAELLANTISKFHTIKNVQANIFGRKSYLAKGNYTYYDENKSSYVINFASIRPDTVGTTISEGNIPEKDNFRFNDYFSFAGKVKLTATNQFLNFQGGTKMVHNCNRIGKSYLEFNGDINPNEILIPIPNEPKDVKGARIVNAVMYSPDTSGVYSGFVSPKSGKKDQEIIHADGYLSFDKASGEYRISSKEKLIEQNLPGNFLSLNTSSCVLYGEGKFDFGIDLGQLEFNEVGSATHYTINDSAVLFSMATVNFFFEEKALRRMVSDFEVAFNILKPTDFSDTKFKKGLTELIGKEKSDKVVGELELNGKIKRFPDELNKTFFFNNINFNYDGKLKSFISTGKIGLGNILKDEINRFVPGIIKIDKMKSGGDKMTIYLEIDKSTWYYFEYFKGVLKTYSSNKEFNEIIKELKPKKRKQSVEKGPSFQFVLGSEKLKNTFLAKFGPVKD